MSDPVITASNVVPQTGATIKTVTAGEAIVAGQTIYIKSTDGKAYKSDNDDATARNCNGVACNSAPVAGQPVSYVEAGPIALGAVLTAGTPYYISDTAGGMCVHGDLSTPQRVIFLGHAISTSVLNIGIYDTAVTL